MFEAANTGCAFNSFNINKQLRVLEENPIPKRNIIYYRDLDGGKVLQDAQKKMALYWSTVWVTKRENSNKYHTDGKLRYPSNTEDGVIGVDGYSNSQSGRKYGSKSIRMDIQKI